MKNQSKKDQIRWQYMAVELVIWGLLLGCASFGLHAVLSPYGEECDCIPKAGACFIVALIIGGASTDFVPADHPSVLTLIPPLFSRIITRLRARSRSTP